LKKVLVVILAFAVLLSLTGIALGSISDPIKKDRFKLDRFKKPVNGATVDGDINKTIEQATDASATSGGAYSVANTAGTAVNSDARATALDASSVATNDSAILAENAGDANATTGDASADNDVTNEECQVITETAEATVECDFDKIADGNNCDCDGDNGPVIGPASNCSDCIKKDGKCDKCKLCDCCPATVKGDINIDVKQNTTATATSGDANAIGNASDTDICNVAKALANDGGTADNTSTVVVSNTGIATSSSGSASASNTVDNRVNIDIFRGALTSKSISKFAIW